MIVAQSNIRVLFAYVYLISRNVGACVPTLQLDNHIHVSLLHPKELVVLQNAKIGLIGDVVPSRALSEFMNSRWQFYQQWLKLLRIAILDERHPPGL